MQSSDGQTALAFCWYVGAACLIGMFGALNLPFPFVADQAAVMAGAKVLQAGGTLYIDFWDNKMPAIYWFYQIAGEFISYSEFGVHSLELFWLSLFSIVLMITLRSYYQLKWLSALAPVATVGVYYVAAEAFHLTQLENLVGFPIFMSAWFATKATGQWQKILAYGFISGLCAGITVTFKLVFAPLFVGFWCVASWHVVAGAQPSKYKLSAFWLGVSGGTGAILFAVALKFHLDDALRELYWTAFVYPGFALEGSPRAQLHRLASSLVYFSAYYATWVVFITVAVVHWWREEQRHPLTTMMLAWIVVGIGVILIQRFSWWPYHFLMLFTPAGVLGVRGVDVAVRYLHRSTTNVKLTPMVLALLLVAPCVGTMLIPASQKADIYIKVFWKKRETVTEFREAINQTYAKIRHSIRFLNDSEARKGPIYVFGDPLYYYLSGRRQAAPITGWPWEYFIQSQWRGLPRQLEKTRPPYLYIDDRNQKIMKIRGAGVPEFIEAHYTSLFRDLDGTWYGAKPRSW